MCGITGFIDIATGGASRERRLAIGMRMAEAIRYRGPDDGGAWAEDDRIVLAHRRLSIIDLSVEGHQPMISSDGRYVMVYNGEVYNFQILRHDLEKIGFSFRGHSDTEVMLAAIQAWGVEAAVKCFVGMFAIALWDRRARELVLIRDRLGIKPLYYGWLRGVFVFGSELKALSAYPGFEPEIDRDAMCLYLRHGYIPAPYTVYKDIYKLLPGHIVTVPKDAVDKTMLRESAFWSIRQVAEHGLSNQFHSEHEALEILETTLMQAVGCRMIADVPLGAFLSGGVDSSTVVALMQAQSLRPVKTFSIGFHEAKYDEAVHARRVAEHLGTEHTEIYVTAQEALSVIPRLPQMFDEPFADSSQIPTYLVSKLARKEVIVSLSGDGGDELFAGYDRYTRGVDIWNKLTRMPLPMRKLLGVMLEDSPSLLLKMLCGPLSMLSSRGRDISPDRLQKLGSMVGAVSQQALYRELLGHWRKPSSLLQSGSEPEYFLSDERNWRVSHDAIENMCFADMNSYLPDDILTKVDRASMAVSLESRVPILDHRVVEFAWRVPMHMKKRGDTSKWLLRQLLYKYVPSALIERPKMGFGVPIDEWLRGPLREWAEALLNTDRLRQEGFFNPELIRTKWEEHITGRRRWHYYLWDILMFQAWNEGAKAKV